MALVKQDDKQIDCTFCDGKADVYAEYGLHGIRALFLHCEPCNFKTELDRKYWGQIEAKEK